MRHLSDRSRVLQAECLTIPAIVTIAADQFLMNSSRGSPVVTFCKTRLKSGLARFKVSIGGTSLSGLGMETALERPGG